MPEEGVREMARMVASEELRAATDRAGDVIATGAKRRLFFAMPDAIRAYAVRTATYVVDNPEDPFETREVEQRRLVVRDFVDCPQGDTPRKLIVLEDFAINRENYRVQLKTGEVEGSDDEFVVATDADRVRFWNDFEKGLGRYLRTQLSSDDYLTLRYLSDAARMASAAWARERFETLELDPVEMARHLGIPVAQIALIKNGAIAIHAPLLEVLTGRLPTPAEQARIEATRKKEKARISSARSRFLRRLSAEARLILPYLHLPTSRILEEGPPMTGNHLQYVVGRVLEEFDFNTRRDVVRKTVQVGITRLDTKTLPPAKRFTLRERQVGSRLLKKDSEIAAELGMTYQTVLTTIRSLRRKFGQAGNRQITRAEMVVMADSIPGFAPTQEEIDEAARNPYAGFSPLEKRVIPLLHMPSIYAMAKKLGSPHTYASVKNAIGSGQEKVGATSRVGFALEMSRRGVKYHIRVPSAPIEELVDSEDLAIVGSGALANSNTKIAEDNEIEDPKDVDYAVSRVKAKLGARSRVELALMLQTAEIAQQQAKAHQPDRGLVLA